MARVVVTADARRDLYELITSRNLPADTADRLRDAIQPLANFPDIGPELVRPLDGRRFLLGPWRWMIVVYRHYPGRDLVAVVAIIDGRASSSPLANR